VTNAENRDHEIKNIVIPHLLFYLAFILKVNAGGCKTVVKLSPNTWNRHKKNDRLNSFRIYVYLSLNTSQWSYSANLIVLKNSTYSQAKLLDQVTGIRRFDLIPYRSPLSSLPSRLQPPKYYLKSISVFSIHNNNNMTLLHNFHYTSIYYNGQG
jgi:hypothetical protein